MITLLILWLLAGLVAYIMMLFCDVLAKVPLCDGHFFVLDYPLADFIMSIILGGFTLFIGLKALREWKNYISFKKLEMEVRAL